MKTQNFSVVIPTYNDTKYLSRIVSELKKSKYCGEVIVVDDGSLPAHKKVLEHIPGIVLCTYATNFGKARALLTGVRKAAYNKIAFVDADLQTFFWWHLDAMVELLERERYDMVIGSREKETFATKLIGWSQAYTGERVFSEKKELLENKLLETENYLVEPRLNEYFFHKKKVGMANLYGLEQTLKIKKRGLRVGFVKEAEMLASYVSYLGVMEFVYQLAFIKRIEVKVVLDRFLHF